MLMMILLAPPSVCEQRVNVGQMLPEHLPRDLTLAPVLTIVTHFHYFSVFRLRALD